METRGEILDRHLRRMTALHFAASDMNEALETARYLLGDHPETEGHDGGMPWHVRRTLEVGMFVVYARAFTTSRGLPRMKLARGLSDELKATHRGILERRREFYAHNDDTPHRRILEIDLDDLESVVGPPFVVSEQWSAPTRELLADVVQLAAANLTAFIEEIERLRPLIRAELSATGSRFD
jgi:hypothetical protein